MDYKSLIEKLISELNIDSELGRKTAYNKCIDYAKENFKAPKEFNSFIAQAAKMLDQLPFIKDVAAESTPASGNEKLHLSYSQQTGPVLTGNKPGLSYLSRLLANLAASEKSGEHTHLRYGEFPMYGKTFPLTIYFENDFWFFKHANKPPETKEAPPEKRTQRNIDPSTIVAFVVFDNVPPIFSIIRGNIYKVQSCAKYQDQKVWVKGISDQSDRLFVFEFNGDDGITHQIAFDLDDLTVLFITERDIKKLT
jgi:hypothetical protein